MPDMHLNSKTSTTTRWKPSVLKTRAGRRDHCWHFSFLTIQWNPTLHYYITSAPRIQLEIKWIRSGNVKWDILTLLRDFLVLLSDIKCSFSYQLCIPLNICIIKEHKLYNNICSATQTLFKLSSVATTNNSSPGPWIFPNNFHLYCECYITAVTAYRVCKMSVTHGGVFTALGMPTYLCLFLCLRLPPSLTFCCAWMRRSGKRWAEREQQPPLYSLVWCFMQKSVAAPFFHTGNENWTSYTSSERK